MASATTTTTTNTIDTTGTIYLFNPQSNMFVPYKPDFSGGIPVNDFNMLQQQRMSKQRAPVRDNQMGIIVPLVRVQPRQSDWAQLASVAQRYPRVNTVAVVSPSQDSRGLDVDAGPDAEFSNGIAFLQNSSVIVLGYMMINDQITTLDTQRTIINRWRDWYPSINGLYFDITTQNFSGVESLASYAKVDKGFRYVFANLAASTSGGAVNRTDDFVKQMKGVDTFVIYEREGYPVDAWYASMKKDWMSQYPRSKFAFVAYRVGPETLECRNFIDKCVGIEKIAGYIYVQGGGSMREDDRRKMREWSSISPLTEICLNQLSTQAVTESIPATRGIIPQSTVVDSQKGDAGLEGGKGSASEEESPETIDRQDIEFDKFGVRKIYPSASTTRGGGNDWYLFAENPRADSSIKDSLPKNLVKEEDGSWSVEGGGDGKKGQQEPVRLETWSPKDKKFLNVEITGYFKALNMPSNKSTKYLIQQSARGGHLYEDMKKNWCEGSGYTGQLMTNGTVAVVKTVHSNANTGNRGTTQATTTSLENRWIGMKTVIYNYTRIIPDTEGDVETFVGMEIWIDDNVTDESGNLVMRNDWKHVMAMNDEGGWFASDVYSAAAKSKNNKKGFRKNNNCPSLDINRKKEKEAGSTRQRDEIITMPGGTDDQNCVTWGFGSDAKVAFKHLSVREITRVSRD